jgi:hypothetical protein
MRLLSLDYPAPGQVSASTIGTSAWTVARRLPDGLYLTAQSITETAASRDINAKDWGRPVATNTTVPGVERGLREFIADRYRCCEIDRYRGHLMCTPAPAALILAPGNLASWPARPIIGRIGLPAARINAALGG